jgi:hypothetical protein
MVTLEEFISDSARHHATINPFFETGMYSLVADVEAIAKALESAGVAFEIIGGVAVNAHILPLSRSRSFVTRDIDILLHRDDLDKAAHAAEPLGYQGKKMMGGFTLIKTGQELGEAIHLVFAGEKSKSTQPTPHPDLNPEMKDLFGVTLPVAPLRDLLNMKLSSFRRKDITHIEIMDATGLITPDLEQTLPPILLDRLRQAREAIAAEQADIEG